MSSSKRTVLITGCSDGSLGAALARAFHKAGWRVFASARNPTKLKGSIAAGIETVQLDVSSADSIKAGVAQVQSLTGGSLDALVNNAGGAYSLPLMDVDIERVRQVFELNVFSLLNVTRAFVPLLMKSAHGGLLVNNTSGASMTAGGMPFSGAYSASKAAATSMTEILRLELAPFNVRVINLLTGAIKSTFFDNAPTAILPADSMYNPAKEAIENAMQGADTAKNGSDADEWAEAVVKDLNKSSPPHWVWRGKYASTVRFASLLPIGTTDSIMKSKVGLDVLERNLLAAKKASSKG